MWALRHYGPHTHTELIDRLPGESPSGVRTRTSELQGLGWVTPLLDDAGQVVKRRAEGGMPSIVWRACDDGERTGVDPTAVVQEVHDAGIDRSDLAAMRAAIEDALRIYDDARVAFRDDGDDAHLIYGADDMAQRLRALHHQPIVLPDLTGQPIDATMPPNDRADRLW